MNSYFIYIVTNVHNTVLYIGVTNDLARRIEEHQFGKIPGFTSKYSCTKLVYFEETSSIDDAIAREKQLKKWNRSKKIWLIETMNVAWQDLYGADE